MTETKKFGLIVVICLASLAFGRTDSEKRIHRKDLPPPVEKTVQEQSKGATIRGFSREVEDGKTFYEVEMTVNGHSKDVLINPSGAVVEVEEEVALESVPAAAKAAIEKYAGTGKILKVESVKRDGRITYETKVQREGMKSEIKVRPDGTLIRNMY